MSTKAVNTFLLSKQQERLWIYQQECSIYHNQCAVLLEGHLREDIFQQALQQTFAQHEIFQVVFRTLPATDMPVQIMGRSQTPSYLVVNIEEIATSSHSTLLDTCFTTLAEKPFDLTKGPLLRTILFRLSANTHVLLLHAHALCADDATLPLFVTHLNTCYMAHLEGRQYTHEPLQYVDVCAWQQKLLTSESAHMPDEFWRGLNLSSVSHMHLPFEQTPQRDDYITQTTPQTICKPQTLNITMSASLCTQVSAFAQQTNVSVEEFWLACWAVLLGRFMQQTTLMMGVACDGRMYEELTEILGLYTRFVPLPLQVEPSWAFTQVLNTITPLLRQSRQWQFYCPWSGTQATDATYMFTNPFSILFEYNTWPAALAGSSFKVSPWRIQSCTEPFALKLSICQFDNFLHSTLSYDANCLPYSGMQRLVASLQWLVEQIVAQPQALVSSFAFLRVPEQQELQECLRGPHIPSLSMPLCLQQLFEEQAQRWPERIALESRQEALSYGEANALANQQARWLRRQGVGPNVLVGVCMTRSARTLVTVLAILKAGGGYAPMDGESPSARIVEFAQRAQVALVLTQGALKARLAGWQGRVECVEDLEMEISGEAKTNLTLCNQPGDMAYLIPTSGSTGTPKGVVIQHRSAVNYSLGLCAALKLESGWSFATVSSLAADLGNTAIFGAWATGGSVQILDYEIVTSREAFAGWVKQHPVDVLKIVPSHLSALLGEEEEEGGEILPRQILLLGGEVFPQKIVGRLRRCGCRCRVYNHYGPTETTVGVLVHEMEDVRQAGKKESNIRVPLGLPLAQSEVYVLDKQQHMVPRGIRGELYIGGAGLAMGYWQQGEQTAERFVPNGFAGEKGQRLYRTGDLVRINELGEIEFEGREDGQVKLRGYRVELGEIEALLIQHPNVRMGAVALRENEVLIGYVVARKQDITSQELREYLHTFLPEYMVPSLFVACKSLPLTPNGKLDRRQLVTADPTMLGKMLPTHMGSDEAQSLLQPRDLIEFQLLRIWEEILPTQSISIVDNFFDLGGHSLLAVRLMASISRQFGQNLPLPTLFQYPTLVDLAEVLRKRVNAYDQKILIGLQTSGSRPPFFCVHPAGRSAFDYTSLARRLGKDQPFYGFQSPDLVQTDTTLTTVEELAASYLAAIQTVQPRGPYLIGGWSAGGVVAFEIAQQLRRAGHEVALLAIIDSQFATARMRAKAIEVAESLGDQEIVATAIDDLKIAIPDNFYARSIASQLEYVIEKATQMNVLPIDVDSEQALRIFRVSKRHNLASRLYIPQSYHGHIDYFLASAADFPQNLDDAANIPAHFHALLDWCEIAKGGIKVHPLLSNHRNVIEEPFVQELATLIMRCIVKIC